MGSLADEGGINAARLWVVMERFLATTSMYLHSDDVTRASQMASVFAIPKR